MSGGETWKGHPAILEQRIKNRKYDTTNYYDGYDTANAKLQKDALIVGKVRSALVGVAVLLKVLPLKNVVKFGII